MAGRSSSVIVINWLGHHTNARFALIHFMKKYDLPTGHIASLEMDDSYHYISCSNCYQGSQSTVLSVFSILQNGLDGRIRTYTILLTGWHDPEAGKQIWSSCKRLTIFKLVSALFETISQHHWIEQGSDLRCPWCQWLQEALTHVFQCSRASEMWSCALSRVPASRQVKSTSKSVIDTLVWGISQWFSGETIYWPGNPLGLIDDIGQLVSQALKKQQQHWMEPSYPEQLENKVVTSK